MGKMLRVLTAGVLIASLAIPAHAENLPVAHEAAPAAEEAFTDVPENSTYYVPVQFLREKRIIQGYGDGTFRPQEPVKRIEALSMIMKSATALPSSELTAVQQFNLPVDTILNLNFPTETNLTIKTPSMETPITLDRTGVLELVLPNGGILRSGRIFLNQTPIFTDVKQTDWFFGLVERAVSLDIVKGYPDGTFKPGQTANLAETLAVLLRTHRISIDPKMAETVNVEDVPKNEWYAPLMGYAFSKTIVIPNYQNHVEAEKPMTRGELSAMLYRFLRSQENVKFGRASWYGDGLSRVRLKSHKEYADQNLTAAHRELAFGTVVRVKNLRNGQTVDVVINDRGPYLPGRIIDLSRTAFSKIAPAESGIIPVEVEIISSP